MRLIKYIGNLFIKNYNALTIQNDSPFWKKLKRNPSIIKRVYSADDNFYKMALSINPFAIKFIENASEELEIYSVRVNPMALNLIVKQTPEVCKVILTENDLKYLRISVTQKDLTFFRKS